MGYRGLLVSFNGYVSGISFNELICYGIVATNAKGDVERYWGVDHMGQLCEHLGLERTVGKGWKALL